jgi:hypothetical protein
LAIAPDTTQEMISIAGRNGLQEVLILSNMDASQLLWVHFEAKRTTISD